MLNEQLQAAGILVTLHYTAVEAGNAERISGVSQRNQDSWRKRGLLLKASPFGRRDQFDTFGLSFLMALRLLGGRGGPTAAVQPAKQLALGIAGYVLQDPRCYAGDFAEVLSWDPNAIATAEATVCRLIRKKMPIFTPAEAREEMQGFGVADKTRADWVRHEIFRRRQYPTTDKPFFVWFANGQFGWAETAEAVFQNGGSRHGDPRFAGPVVVLDQEVLAAEFLARAAPFLPLVKVEILPETVP
jgi:hypothetical protein